MTNETIAPAVASTAVGGTRTGARVAPERLSESIADAIGVHLDSADVKLRDHIPNSLTFLQMLLALEDEYGVSIDYAAMDPCLLYTSPSPRDLSTSRMPSSA